MKNIIRYKLFFQFLLFPLLMTAQSSITPDSLPPDWAKDAIWYQIFVERFNNGDPTNNPTADNIKTASDFRPVPDDWSVTPWEHNWYKQENWAKKQKMDFYGGLQLRRFGGDLQGILNKLDYLEDLGITAIYLNPINDAPSLHKYDARNYHHVDVNFGPDPVGDNKIIATENPNDPSTWKWTSADKLFLKLVDELHQRNIRIILDYSWNHTGVEFWAWRDILANQENSKYKEWYAINNFDDPNTKESEFEYDGWLNLKSLPELKKVNVTTKKRIGHPYEGDINTGAKQHIYAVTQRWLSPDGDTSKGIDGFRLDVADHIGMIFWRDWRKYVKSINPEAYLVGEVWWEKWPDKLMNPVPFVKGDVFDAVMFYQVYKPARYFFAKTNFEIDAKQFTETLSKEWKRLKKPVRYAMMNTAATHDSPRLLSSFYNPNKYKYNAKPDADTTYKTGKPDAETYARVKLYLIHQFTSIGAPHIWNGDEMGMWGGDDPDCRKPLWWPEYSFEPEYTNNIQKGKKRIVKVGFNQKHFDFYKSLIQIRKDNPVLSNGRFELLKAEGKILVYRRYDKTGEIIVAFNAGDKKGEFLLPDTGSKYLDLLSGKPIKGKRIQLLPLSAKILNRISR